MNIDLPLFEFASEAKQLQVFEGEVITTPLAQINPHKLLEETSATTGKESLICGIIPFNPHHPSHLIKTTDYQWIDLPTSNISPEMLSNSPRVLSPSETEQTLNQEHKLHYEKSVEQALEEIANDQYQKIVLARAQKFTIPSTSSVDYANNFDRLLFSKLLQTSPAADIFTVRTSSEESWTGASPEVISDVQHKIFRTHPLAGSLSQEVEPNRELAQSHLFDSPKDLGEHAFVVDHIKTEIEKLTGIVVHVPSQPSLTATDTMWHLGTPISALLPENTNALTLAQAIHPTPAVCGVPTAETLQRIEDLELEPRSFYSGLVGWMDTKGNGRWSLVLRCAHRKQEKLTVFAGAGIVDGSIPASELAETEAKMQTIIKALSPQMESSFATTTSQ